MTSNYIHLFPSCREEVFAAYGANTMIEGNYSTENG
jgi:hypothetical protein